MNRTLLSIVGIVMFLLTINYAVAESATQNNFQINSTNSTCTNSKCALNFSGTNLDPSQGKNWDVPVLINTKGNELYELEAISTENRQNTIVTSHSSANGTIYHYNYTYTPIYKYEWKLSKTVQTKPDQAHGKKINTTSTLSIPGKTTKWFKLIIKTLFDS